MQQGLWFRFDYWVMIFEKLAVRNVSILLAQVKCKLPLLEKCPLFTARTI